MGGGSILEGGWAWACAQGWGFGRSCGARHFLQLAPKVTTTFCPSACTYPPTFFPLYLFLKALYH